VKSWLDEMRGNWGLVLFLAAVVVWIALISFNVI